MEKNHIDILREVADAKLIKLPQLMLLVMANKRHAGWHVADITKAAGAQASAITMAKQKLIEQELVVEHFPERDKRVTKVYLTEKGHEEASRMWDLLRALVAAEEIIRTSGSPA